MVKIVYKIWRNERDKLMKEITPNTREYWDSQSSLDQQTPIAYADVPNDTAYIYLDRVLEEFWSSEYEARFNSRYITEIVGEFITRLAIHELIHLIGGLSGGDDEKPADVLTDKMMMGGSP